MQELTLEAAGSMPRLRPSKTSDIGHIRAQNCGVFQSPISRIAVICPGIVLPRYWFAIPVPMYPLLHGWRGRNDSEWAPGTGCLSYARRTYRVKNKMILYDLKRWKSNERSPICCSRISTTHAVPSSVGCRGNYAQPRFGSATTGLEEAPGPSACRGERHLSPSAVVRLLGP